MEKYLICLNLDDTLLNKKKKISFLSNLVLKEILQRGHYLILTSKEDYQTIFPYIKKLKLYNYPFICLNGGAIYYINRKKIITKNIASYIDDKDLNNYIKSIDNYLSLTFYSLEKSSNILIKNCIGLKITIKKNLKKAKFLNYFVLEKNQDTITYLITSKKASKYNSLVYIKNKFKIKANNVITFNFDQSDQEIYSSFENSYFINNSSLEGNKTKKPSYKNGVINTLIEKYRKVLF